MPQTTLNFLSPSPTNNLHPNRPPAPPRPVRTNPARRPIHGGVFFTRREPQRGTHAIQHPTRTHPPAHGRSARPHQHPRPDLQDEQHHTHPARRDRRLKRLPTSRGKHRLHQRRPRICHREQHRPPIPSPPRAHRRCRPLRRRRTRTHPQLRKHPRPPARNRPKIRRPHLHPAPAPQRTLLRSRVSQGVPVHPPKRDQSREIYKERERTP